MKLLFVCAAAALASQDLTPPTISLTLPDVGHPSSATDATYVDRNCATHPCTKKTVSTSTPQSTVTLQNSAGKYQSATCEYGANAAKCPLPTCKAYDHHDLHCRADDTACPTDAAARDAYCHEPHAIDTSSGAAAQSFQGVRINATTYSRCTHEFDCTATYTLINEDGNDVSAAQSSVDRNLRSEWLITYGAADRSQNQAESVSFAMIFQDTQAPSLETEFCRRALQARPNHRDDLAHDVIQVTANTAGTGDTTDNCSPSIKRKFAQSCTVCQENLSLDDSQSFNQTITDCPNPCVMQLTQPKAVFGGQRFRSVDDYDGDVNSNVAVSLTSPSNVTTNCTSGCDIDTQELGTWTMVYTSHDNANMYGTGEFSNEVKQTVTIDVVDNRKPHLFLNGGSGNFGEDETQVCGPSAHTPGHGPEVFNDPIVECDLTKTYTRADGGGNFLDPGAECKDLRNSWKGPSTRWQHAQIVANNDIDNVDVASLDKTDVGCSTYTCSNDVGASSSHYVNTYSITYDCDDGSTNPSANSADQLTRTVRVEDTTPPQVVIQGSGHVYSSAGYNTHANNANNEYEGAEGRSNSHDSTDCTGHYDSTTSKCRGAYHDTGFLDFTALSVGVRDTRVNYANNLANGEADGQALNGHKGGTNQSEWSGATCTDTCNPSPTMVATLHEGHGCSGNLVSGDGEDGDLQNFPEFTAGTYSIKYTCSDGDDGDLRPGLIHSACRNITNVDATKPIIQILGNDEMTLEATHEGNYVDDGAVCYDQVDGVISQNIEVSGDVVNLAKVGTYIITYNCKDSAGNVAPVESRTVHVQQTSCPKCSVTGCDVYGAYGTASYNCTQRHEASFSYTDPGAACSDLIDGVVNYNTTNPVDVETTGEYVIEYRAKNSVNRFNDDSDCIPGPNSYFRTILVVDTLKPLIVVKYNNVEVARGSAADTSATDTNTASFENPAKDFDLYMAEEPASVGHSWAVGAAVAALAGVALLAHSSHRSNVATSVPV